MKKAGIPEEKIFKNNNNNRDNTNTSFKDYIWRKSTKIIKGEGFEKLVKKLRKMEDDDNFGECEILLKETMNQFDTISLKKFSSMVSKRKNFEIVSGFSEYCGSLLSQIEEIRRIEDSRRRNDSEEVDLFIQQLREMISTLDEIRELNSGNRIFKIFKLLKVGWSMISKEYSSKEKKI